MTRKIKTKQLIHTFLFLLSLLLRGFKVPDKAGGSQVSQGEATQDYLPLENTSRWKIERKMVFWHYLWAWAQCYTSTGTRQSRLAVRVTLWLSPGLPSWGNSMGTAARRVGGTKGAAPNSAHQRWGGWSWGRHMEKGPFPAGGVWSMPCSPLWFFLAPWELLHPACDLRNVRWGCVLG